MSAVADVRPALIGHLKELHLPTVRQCYEETARCAERETLSYEQYLLEVISRECEQRHKKKVQRLLKESALPLEKSLQNFDVKRLPAKAQRQLRTLLEGRLSGPEGECTSVRESWVWKESSFDSSGARVGRSAGTQNAFHQVRPAHAGFTG